MKRTPEFVLGLIGVILSALSVLGGFFFVWASGSNEVMNEMRAQMEINPAVDAETLNEMMGLLGSIGWLLVAAAAFGLVFGMIGIINIRRNKRPKLAGWMFIIGALLFGFLSFGTGFLPALLLLIAGVMSLARKAGPQDAV